MTGSVKDESTGKPVYNANIFLANTTIGTASGPDGNFSIPNIPPGQYKLVVSMIGYNVVHQTVHIRDDQVISIQLHRSSLQGETVTITAEQPGAWQKNFSAFRDLLLGGSEFSDSCIIKNTHVLILEYDRQTHTLSAKTKQPLHIQNNALGYDVFLTIDEFIYQGVGFYKFKGSPFFKPKKTASSRQRNYWEENRKIAYNGSLRHFLAVLSGGAALQEQGFKVYHTGSVSQQPDNSQKRKPGLQVHSDSIIFPGHSQFESIIHFDDYLKILYKNEPESSRYRQYSKARAFQTSWIFIDSDEPVEFNIAGYLYDPYQIKTYGYWAWKGIAESLPFDYQPEQIQHSRAFVIAPVMITPSESQYPPDAPSYEPDQLYNLSIKHIREHDCAKASPLLYQGLELEMKHGSIVYDSVFSNQAGTSISLDSLLFIGMGSAEKVLQFWQNSDPTPASPEHEIYCTIISRIQQFDTLSDDPAIKESPFMRTVFLERGMPDTILKSYANSHIGQNICWVYKSDSLETVYDFIISGKRYIPFPFNDIIVKNPSRALIENILDFIQSRSSGSASYKKLLDTLNNELSEKEILVSETSMYDFLNTILYERFSVFYRDLLYQQKADKNVKLKKSYGRLNIKNRVVAIPDKSELLLDISLGIPCDYLDSVETETGVRSSFLMHYSVFTGDKHLIKRKSFNGTITYNSSIPHSRVLGIFDITERCPKADTLHLFIQVTDTVSGCQWESGAIAIIPKQSLRHGALWLSDAIPCYSFNDSVSVIYPDTLCTKDHIGKIKFFASGLVSDSAGLCHYTYNVRIKRADYHNRGKNSNILLPPSTHTNHKTCIEETVNIRPGLPGKGEYILYIELKDNISNHTIFHQSHIHFE